MRTLKANPPQKKHINPQKKTRKKQTVIPSLLYPSNQTKKEIQL